MQRTMMLLAVLGLFTWTASSAGAAHQSDASQRDFSSSLRVAPNTVTLNQPTSDQLAGHCGGGYYGRRSYYGGHYAPRYYNYRPAYSSGYGYPAYYGGRYYRGHHHGHHHHRGRSSFGLYIGF